MSRLVAVLVAAALLLAGCGTATSGQPAPAAGSDGNDTAAWEFSGETLDGTTFDATTIAGTPTVIWFWAPWCPTCRGQIPTLTRLADEYDGRVEFVGAGSLAAGPEIRDTAEQIPHLTHLIDVDGEIWQKFGVTAQSTYEVIDADGDIVSSGYLDNDELEALVAEIAG